MRWTRDGCRGARTRVPFPRRAPEEQALARSLRADVDALALEIGERHDGRFEALGRARTFVAARLVEVGLAPALSTFEHRGRTFANVVADVGSGDGHLLVGAHYDSARGSPGGNDNASGVAALIAIAERLAIDPPAGRVRLVAFVNEEPPHFRQESMGSRVYAARAAAGGDLPRAAIVFDSLGYYDEEMGSQRFPSAALAFAFPETGDFVAFVGDDASDELLRRSIGRFRAAAAFPSEGAALSRRTMGAAWSDHASFWDHGVPAILVSDTAAFRDPSYHDASDDGSNVDELALARVTLGLLEVIRAEAAR